MKSAKSQQFSDFYLFLRSLYLYVSLSLSPFLLPSTLFSRSLVPSESLPNSVCPLLLLPQSIHRFCCCAPRIERIRFFQLSGCLIQAVRSDPKSDAAFARCHRGTILNRSITSGLVTPNLEACGSHTRRKNLAPLRSYATNIAHITRSPVLYGHSHVHVSVS
jgi:hypothetical protein